MQQQRNYNEHDKDGKFRAKMNDQSTLDVRGTNEDAKSFVQFQENEMEEFKRGFI